MTMPSSVELNAEWQHLQERTKAVAAGEIPDPNAMRRAVRWVLVHSFGDVEKYQFDAEFHARVHAAEQMLERLRDLTDGAVADAFDDSRPRALRPGHSETSVD